MRIGPVVPVLRIFDAANAREFYLDFLGFSVDWEHRFEPELPLYLQVSRSDCRLHLSEHHGDACPGSALRIEVDDIDGLLAELKQRPYGFARPHVVETPWGSRDIALTDPFGNRLCFTSAICT